MYAGINTPHKKGEAFSRPQGQNFWIIMCFSTPYLIMNEKREIVRGEAGDYIIQPPFVPLYHINTKEADNGFINDWIVFSSEEIGRLIYELKLPLNTPFQLSESKLLEPYLQKIIEEDSMRSPYYKYKISVHLQEMIVDLKRTVMLEHSPKDSTYRRLVRVRRQIAGNPEKPWTLKAMAELANLSPSRFSDLYKKHFGKSPVSDLISKRIGASKRLLVATDFSVEEIAEKCGFSSIHYFSKCFKKQTGISPSEVRK